jgi:quercetin dioxygenase-like cupin family protein
MSFVDVNNLDEKEIFPGIVGKFIHSKEMTIAFVTIDAGVDLPEHAHVHEQILNVLEGEFEIKVGGEKTILKAGNSFVLASNVPHSGRILKKCKIIDVFNPVREDFKSL